MEHVMLAKVAVEAAPYAIDVFGFLWIWTEKTVVCMFDYEFFMQST